MTSTALLKIALTALDQFRNHGTLRGNLAAPSPFDRPYPIATLCDTIAALKELALYDIELQLPHGPSTRVITGGCRELADLLNDALAGAAKFRDELDAAKEPPAIHFTSDGYTHIKTPTGSYAFKGTSLAALTAQRADLVHGDSRRQRQLAALDAFLQGKSVANPEALR